MRRPDRPDLATVPDLAGPVTPAKDIDFEFVQHYPSTGHYGSMRFGVADFDGDGALDVAMPLQSVHEIALLFGDGKGGFKPVTKLAANGAFKLAVADLNKDGKADLLLTTNTLARNQLFTYLGKGDGTFAAPLASGPTGSWGWPELVDLNSDGVLDVVTESGGYTYVTLGKGDGTFDVMGTALTGISASLVAVGDVSGDGKADVIKLSSFDSTPLEIWPGKGDGSFDAPTRYAALSGDQLTGMVVHDCDGDGKSDLILTDAQGVVVRRGSMLSSGSRLTFPQKAASPALGDWNGDGVQDLVVSIGNGPAFAVLTGRGACDFTNPQYFMGANGNGSFVAKDLDGDKKLDLLFSDTGLLVARGKGDGTFVAGRPHEPALPTSGEATDVTLADVNRDGKIDLVATYMDRRSIAVSLGQGNGSFARSMPTILANKPAQVRVADLTGDGVPDAVVGLADKAGFAVLAGDGAGGWAAPSVYSGGSQIELGDLNGDGSIDVASVGGGSLRGFFNNGKGALNATPGVPVPSNVWYLALADFDKDGRSDAAMIEWSGRALTLASGQLGGFSVVRSKALSADALALALADLDRDGNPDVLLMYAGSSMNVGYLAGRGDGTFADSQALAVDGRSLSTRNWLLADWNSDGWMDLLTIRSNSALQVHRGLPGMPGKLPEFATGTMYQHDFPSLLVAADATGDGRPDLVVASDGTGGFVSVFANRSR